MIDNKLMLSACFTLAEGRKWRNQQVTYTLFIPENKTVFIGSGLKELTDYFPKAHNHENNEWENKYWKAEKNQFACLNSF